MMNPREFENIARAEARLWWYQGMREILYRVLDPLVRNRRFDRVLEAGCGTGYFTAELQSRYGWPMFPMDLARDGLAYATTHGIQRAVQADMCDLPYAGGSVDALVSMDVLVHMPRGEDLRPVAEFRRVLKPGGLLVLRVAALHLLRSRHSIFVHERQRYTRARIVSLLESAGFRVLRASYANSLLLPVALLKFRIWEPLFSREPKSGVELLPDWLNRLLLMPLRWEAALLGAGIEMPLGQSLVVIAEKPR